MTRWSWLVAGGVCIAVVAAGVAWWLLQQRHIPQQFAKRLTVSGQTLTQVQFAPNGAGLVAGSAEGDVIAWESVDAAPQVLEPRSNQPLVQLAVSPDDVLVGTGLRGALRAWQLPAFTKTKMGSPELPVTSIVFRKSRELSVLLGLADGRIAQLSSGKVTLRASGHRGVKVLTMMPKSDVLVSTGTEGKVIWYDLKERKQVASRSEHRAEVSSAEWTADGTRLVTGDWNGQIRVWNPLQHEVVGRAEQPDAVVGLSCRGSKWITGSWDGRIRCWNSTASDPQLDHEINTGLAIHAMSVNADGTRAATVSGRNNVEIWNLSAGSQSRSE